MSKVLYLILFVLCFTLFAYAQSAQDMPPADQLLEDVCSHLPQEPILLSGDIKVRKRKGIVTGSLGFEIFMNMGSQPQIARYMIRDAFGKDLEQLTVTRQPGIETRFEYAKGSPLSDSNLPNLFEFIQGTDISWTDLTLSFLWWSGGTTTGTELLRGQSCFVVDIFSPPDRPAEGRYAKMRLWIDKKLHMILQAEAYDSRGKLIRRIWVKSFKKINERWMIKDMEIQSFPSFHRTKILIREVKVNTQS